MVRILYFGDDDPASTSAHRAQALSRLGHSVSQHNLFHAPTGLLGASWLSPLHYRTGYQLLQGQVSRWLAGVIHAAPKPDLVWVDSGELLGPAAVRILKALGCPLVLYNVDDPTGGRDGSRFASLLKALPLFDLVVVVRKETAAECRDRGAKQVLRVLRSYDEVAHRPFSQIRDIPAQFRTEVAFIGNWMPHENRDEFLLELVRQGVPLSIWGGRWGRSPLWQSLQPACRGGILAGRDYVAAIQGAKLCLGLLSKGNRDLHTTRSLEIPFAAGLLCAERTSDHQVLYQEGKEAVFWRDATECARVCHYLLENEPLREGIRLAGQERVKALRVGNEDICRRILRTACVA